jgi:hypothetical protein
VSRDTTFKIGALAFGFAALVSTLAFFAFVLRGPVPDNPKPIADPTPVVEGTEYAQGWVPDPEAVEKFRATLDTPDFRDTPAGKVVMGEMPSRVYLWQIIRKVTGKDPPIYNQNPVGSCVSFGTARAIEASLASQISLGDRLEWTSLVEEVIYAGSRIEIGRGQIRRSALNPHGDGSVGAWAARFVKGWGALPRGVYMVKGKDFDPYDLRKYDPVRCRAWAESGSQGVPDDLEPEVKKYPVGDTTMVTTWSEAKRALAQGYGIAICSNQGFSSQRNVNGVAVAQGSWAHCMCLDGYHVDENTGKEYGHIQNSWGGNYHRGPVGWGEPPTSGFWAEASVVHRMLSQRDSWAFSQVKGFPARKIDWFAVLPKKQRDDRFTLAISRRRHP